MNSSYEVCEEFTELVEKHFAFLHGYGFRRSPSYESTSPTGCSVVYMGKNVAILLSLDIRDNHVDAQVAKVSGGVLKRNWEGGYSSGLLGHLVKYAGYRGRPSASVGHGESLGGKSSIEQMIRTWADLLALAGGRILEDLPHSLPN